VPPQATVQPIRFWQRSTLTSLRGFLCRGALGGLLATTSCWAQTSPALTAEITAQPLSQALTAFAEQTSIQLIYVSNLASGRVSKGAPAGLPVAEALTRLLDGTGLRFEFLNSRTVRLLPVAVAAQTPATVPSGDGRRPKRRAATRTGVEEILITANKREQRLSIVPISANVLSSQDMDAAGVKNLGEVATLTPGVEYDFSTQWGAGILTNLAIRGISSNVGASTTGIYIDDSPIQARNAYFGNPYPVTFDLERVEVLRGPQGTLFGAGAEGGAVRFITTEPSTTQFSGLYRAELSSTEKGGMSFEAGGAAGGPLVNGRLGVRASAWYREDGGYIDRVNPFTNATVDQNANRSSIRAIRLGVAIEPTDSLRISPSVAYQSVRIHDTPSFYTYLSEPGDGVFRNGKLLRQPADDGFLALSLKAASASGGGDLAAVTSYFRRTASATVDSTNVAGAVFLGGFGNPLGPAYPNSYADAIPTLLRLQQSVLSQEVRLTSSNANAALMWVVGLFYSQARQDDKRYTYAIATPGNPGVDFDDYNLDTLAAGFGNADLSVSSRWTFSFGVRVERTRSDFTEHAGGYAYVGVPPLSHGVAAETPVTPRFGVSYKANEHSLVYASLAKGFRIGGINVGTPAQCGATARPASYASDSVWSHEIGAKDILFNHHLQLAASAFYITWDKIQQAVVFDCGFGFTTNAGAASSTGFDLSADALLSDRVGVGLALGFIDVHYTKTVTADGNVIVDRGRVVGGVPSVPSPWNFMASAEYHLPIGQSVVGYARAEDVVHSHNAGPFTEGDPQSIGYDPTLRADASTRRLNLNLGMIRSGFDVKLSINNALNSRPTLQRFPDAPGSSLYYAYTFRPRTITLTASQRF
jgi:iron complex outermembrane recepter protein